MGDREGRHCRCPCLPCPWVEEVAWLRGGRKRCVTTSLPDNTLAISPSVSDCTWLISWMFGPSVGSRWTPRRELYRPDARPKSTTRPQLTRPRPTASSVRHPKKPKSSTSWGPKSCTNASPSLAFWFFHFQIWSRPKIVPKLGKLKSAFFDCLGPTQLPPPGFTNHVAEVKGKRFRELKQQLNFYNSNHSFFSMHPLQIYIAILFMVIVNGWGFGESLIAKCQVDDLKGLYISRSQRIDRSL